MPINILNSNFFFNSLVTEKTENILPIFILEIFILDIRISGKVLRGILVRHVFCCLVTPHDPLGVTEVMKH